MKKMSQDIARNAINLDDYSNNNKQDTTHIKMDQEFQNYANYRDDQKLRARETVKLQM